MFTTYCIFPATIWKSSIIKAVTQTQFKTCVTAFIVWFQTKAGKVVQMRFWDIFLVRQLFFNDSTSLPAKLLWPWTKKFEWGIQLQKGPWYVVLQHMNVGKHIAEGSVVARWRESLLGYQTLPRRRWTNAQEYSRYMNVRKHFHKWTTNPWSGFFLSYQRLNGIKNHFGISS